MVCFQPGQRQVAQALFLEQAVHLTGGSVHHLSDLVGRHEFQVLGGVLVSHEEAVDDSDCPVLGVLGHDI